MDITVLDAKTLGFSDAAWEDFGLHGELSLYEHTPYDQEEIVARCRNARAVFTNKVPLDAETIARLPQLQYIGVLATGYNIIDLKAAKERNITVTNVPGYSTASVVQHTLALILELTNTVGRHSASVHRKDWVNSTLFSYWHQAPIELSQLTIGIVGYGTIGKPVAELCHLLGARVLASARSSKKHPGWERLKFATNKEIFEQANLISLHCPQTPDNAGFINAELISSMQPGSYLVNTARGGLIDEQAVANALQSGHLAGYAADVVHTEPMKADNPLLGAPNCILTPHMAWASLPARERLLQIAFDNFSAWRNGNPVNIVR